MKNKTTRKRKLLKITFLNEYTWWKITPNLFQWLWDTTNYHQIDLHWFITNYKLNNKNGMSN